jgi:phosphatidylinositol alpha-1,6-mannosyltransferase
MTSRYPGLNDYTHLLIFDDPVPDGGGIQNMAYWLAVHLKQQGLRVVIAGQTKYLRHPAFENSGIEFIESERPFRTTHSSDIRLLSLALRIRRRLPGKVIAYSMIINNIRILRWLQPLLKWKFVSFLHGNEVLRLYHRRPHVLEKNLDACSAVFANSNYTRSIAERLKHFPNIRVVPPGIPEQIMCETTPQSLREQRSWQDRKIILALSRLVKRKGHQTVIEAVARLRQKHPEILLLVAGSGGYRKQLEALVAERNLGEHVLFLGFVAEQDKIALYDTCDLYCMPSSVDETRFDVEGFGITFIEAAARGKVAIGAASGGIPDAIEDGKSGLLIETGDSATLTSYIDDILTNPAAYEEMRQYARERACNEFGWSRSIVKILESLESAISNHSSND